MDIDIKNLGVERGDRKILQDATLKINDGDFIGIIGPNGSGKSTLLKCIYRNIRDYVGTIYFNGRNVMEIPYKESARKISAVSQINEVSFDISVMEMVLMGRSPYKRIMDSDTEEDFTLAENALKKVNMLEYRDRNFTSLSGGEKQRVILARAFCQDTECIILDEPANHLDIKYQNELFNLLKECGKTVITAVHDLNQALRYCNRVCVLKGGSITATGKTDEIITRETIMDLFDVDSRIIDVEGVPAVVYL